MMVIYIYVYIYYMYVHISIIFHFGDIGDGKIVISNVQKNTNDILVITV